MSSSSIEIARAYAASRGFSVVGPAGRGKDGEVFEGSIRNAVKVHETSSGYQTEVLAYQRLLQVGLHRIDAITLPRLLDFEDDQLVIEMTFVRPPFMLDFASARFDEPPDYNVDDGYTLEDLVRDRFPEDRIEQVMHLHYELARLTGIYISDLNPHNIKFE